MTPPARLVGAMNAAGLAGDLLEAVLTIDGAPLFAFVAPPDASVDLLERLERGGGLQAVVLGVDLERWRAKIDDADRDTSVEREAVAAIRTAARVHYDALRRMDAELDRPLAPRRDVRSVLVSAVEQASAWTREELVAAFAGAPLVETHRPRLPAYDVGPLDGGEPAIAGRWVALVPVALPHEVLAMLRFGGFNACPHTAVHVAVLQRWEVAFGVRLLVATPDELALRVARPPSTQRAVHLTRLEQAWLGGDERPTVAETKGRRWRWWWD